MEKIKLHSERCHPPPPASSCGDSGSETRNEGGGGSGEEEEEEEEGLFQEEEEEEEGSRANSSNEEEEEEEEEEETRHRGHGAGGAPASRARSHAGAVPQCGEEADATGQEHGGGWETREDSAPANNSADTDARGLGPSGWYSAYDTEGRQWQRVGLTRGRAAALNGMLHRLGLSHSVLRPELAVVHNEWEEDTCI